MGIKVNLDDRGRITLPKSLREKFGLKAGEELILEETKDDIIIKIKKREYKTVRANIDWKNKAFFKLGEKSFGE